MRKGIRGPCYDHACPSTDAAFGQGRRRVRLEDVMAYKTRIDREREKVLDQLAREAQEQGMGYDVA
jgi:hypothetical protein